MKNNIIVLSSVLNLIIIAIMLLTVSLRNKISSQMFDNAMILFGVLFVILTIITVIIVVKSKTK